MDLFDPKSILPTSEDKVKAIAVSVGLATTLASLLYILLIMSIMSTLLFVQDIGIAIRNIRLQHFGTQTTGVVGEKNTRRINGRAPLFREKAYFLIVKLTPASGESETVLELKVPIEQYQQLNVNDSVKIQYLDSDPAKARIHQASAMPDVLFLVKIATIYFGLFLISLSGCAGISARFDCVHRWFWRRRGCRRRGRNKRGNRYAPGSAWL